MADSITWVDGVWKTGNPMLMGALDHATWLSSVAFDGARAFRGCAPDLELHCARAIRSAEMIGMRPKVTVADIVRLTWEGLARLPAEAEMYVRPLFYAPEGWLAPNPDSTRNSTTNSQLGANT